jgi:hypothetical protein
MNVLSRMIAREGAGRNAVPMRPRKVKDRSGTARSSSPSSPTMVCRCARFGRSVFHARAPIIATMAFAIADRVD